MASKSAFTTELTKHSNVIDGNLMDGEGSLGSRAHKLMRLQRLGMVDKKFDFPTLLKEPAAFDFVEHAALHEARSKVQGKGFLLRHVRGENPRMQEVWYEGDPEVCWGPFKAPGFKGRINTDVGTHEEKTKIRDGEKLVVLRKDGTIAHLDGSEIVSAGKQTTGTKKQNKTHSEVMQDPQYQENLAKQYREDLADIKNMKTPRWAC